MFEEGLLVLVYMINLTIIPHSNFVSCALLHPNWLLKYIKIEIKTSNLSLIKKNEKKEIK